MASDLILLDAKGISILLRRCIHLIKKYPVDFFHIKKLKSQGLWVPSKENEIGKTHNRIHDDSYIVIDPRREFIGSLIHECIHELEPEWNEKQVLYAESRLQNRASLKLILKLLKTFVDKMYKKYLK